MRVLLIEDDKELSGVMSFHLKKHGYEVDACFDGGDASYYISQQVHDCIILDRLLPNKDGLTILKELRESGNPVPVILVTAMDGVNDRIAGLDTGADDYVIKPFSVEELLARVRALMRRPTSIKQPLLLTYSDLSLDIKNHFVSVDDKQCSLSKKECALFEYFIKNPERTLSRELLILRIWGADASVGDGNLDNYIHFLRRRLDSLKSRVRIVTVHASGYRMEELSC